MTKGFIINITGIQIIAKFIKKCCKDYWDYISQSGFPSVEPDFKGIAIINPIIEGAYAVDLSIPQWIVHL
jgi:hypothetical protein